MCGIAGILNLAAGSEPIEKKPLELMIASLRHRGPDESGIYLDDHVGLAQSRLSIIDLSGGSQPMCNEDKTLWVVFNGEIFNYKELFPELIAKGHRFITQSDTETILHAYEQYGPDCVHHFNGQFAFALWDSRKRELFCARDRIGIRPLHYTIHNGGFIFASEIKAIFSLPEIPRQLDPVSMDQVFTFWTTLPGRTVFENIFELPPGHTLTIKAGQVHIKRFWRIPFCSHRDKLTTPLPQLVEQTNALLHDAIRLRLRADVPVGCYLSGGIDSSGISARVVRDFDSQVHTFGIRFQESAFDEGDHQQLMVKRLGVHHTELLASNLRIGQAFRQTVMAAEKPLLRTGPVPLFLLSGAVHDAGMKVVLTGEGADEFFGGYDIFRETRVRRCLARFPNSIRRQALIGDLYPDIFRDPKTKTAIQSFFTKNLDTVGHPLSSHLIRWENTRRARLFFSDELKGRIGSYDAYNDLTGQLPQEFGQWDYFSRAQYLESDIFLSNYLLSSQGDRVAMAHSLEIRVPFLDYRLMELLARVPTRWKIFGTKEKYLLKKVFSDTLPQEILSRRKHPYRAPIVQSLLKTGIADHMDALSESAVRKVGLFDSSKVGRLVTKLKDSGTASEVDSMALAGILSTQLLYADLVENPIAPKPPGKAVCYGLTNAAEKNRMFDSTLVHEWLTCSAKKFPDKPAIICAQRSVTYRQLDTDSDRLAEMLLEQGLLPQDRVVIFMDNSIETVVSLYGVLKAGGAFVILNTSLKADKLAYILDNADAVTLISHTSKGRIVMDALDKVQSMPKTIWVHPGKTLPEPIANATSGLHWDSVIQRPLSGVTRPRITDKDLAALVYTSGSTGQPKGVMQPHGKMVSVAQSIIQYLENTSDEIILNVLSLSFGYGLYQILMSVMAGGTVVLERSFVYLHDVLRKIGQYQVTAFPLVPTIAAMLLNMNELSTYDFSSLRYITSAGAALPGEHSRRMRQLWPHVKIIAMHGLTECVRTCYLPADRIDEHPDSVGVAIGGCQLSIVDEQGNEVGPGQVGEMVVSGHNVMPGYWKDPQLTAQVFRPGKVPGQVCLYTGDLFRRDREGLLYFVARKDDMIKTRGERVSPREIENTLLRMEGIAEVVVIGIPDAILGQVPKAFLVRKKDSTLTENEVLLFASQNLENFMVPKIVRFLPELPKTPNGKIDKQKLKEQE